MIWQMRYLLLVFSHAAPFKLHAPGVAAPQRLHHVPGHPGRLQRSFFL
jgi:hypothetical protein